MDFPKGSEWRRWDLHIHTKYTLKNDQFKSKNFTKFCITLFKNALVKGITSIGITDYFSIDNYKNVCLFVNEINNYDEFTPDEKTLIENILLIPNVELRMLPVTDKGRLVNIHCIFNPEFVDKLDNHFFNKLKHSEGPGSNPLMNRQGMIELGKSSDPKLGDDEAYKKGISEFVVSHERLQEHLDSDKVFRENVIIAVSNSNNDGASGLQKHYDLFEGIDTSSLGSVRRAIYKLSDCIFSSNPKDIKYFSGKGVDDIKTVQTKCGSLKPCIHCSDAHTEDELFNPIEDRYCWIKADPTFNGFRQIIFEPNPGERVWIGPTIPDKKDDFKIINKIEFRDTKNFPKQILFNKNLCSINGSRSSGKSALLAYIADSVDRKQTREKKEKGPGEGFPWDDVDFDYSIEWANGSVNQENLGKVVYIPQNFLYEMSGKR